MKKSSIYIFGVIYDAYSSYFETFVYWAVNHFLIDLCELLMLLILASFCLVLQLFFQSIN